MTLTLRVLGLELLMLDITTDPPDDTGYDHDVVSTALDAEPDGDVACGFVAPGVECE